MQTYLEHHGVKGMKWGVRKRNKVISKLQKKVGINDYKTNVFEKGMSSNDAMWVAAQKTAKLNTLSDTQLDILRKSMRGTNTNAWGATLGAVGVLYSNSRNRKFNTMVEHVLDGYSGESYHNTMDDDDE